MGERPSWMAEDVDPSVPSSARSYDYLLGGSHNFAADRAAADAVLALMPSIRDHARQNRSFLHRAVRHLVGEGIDQFLDLGSGIPTVGTVHEVAGELDPQARVVYVDRDPVAVTHGQQVLAGHDRAVMVAGDLREPDRVLADPTVRASLDFDRPIAVLFVAVLHFVPDETMPPAEIVDTFLDAVAPGSQLVISHPTTGQGLAELQRAFAGAGARELGTLRSFEEIHTLFGATQLVDPGLVRTPLWRPEHPDDVPPDVGEYPGYAGVGVRS